LIRSHRCDQLNNKIKGQKVTLAGWVERRRDHGGLIFIDLRDGGGLVQVVFNPERSKECHKIASRLRNEYVIRTDGEVSIRPSGTENTKLASGDIEIIADRIEILNESETPPFYINEETEIDENLRLKYRYLDLRRPQMQNILIQRHQVVKFIRDFLNSKGFIDIETPILIKSTPEGARDYLVPSRIYPGKFYALPQSPQQLKQLLMVAGVEKYYQIAKCFRDEDTRADRQPEFTQLDIEMSFIDEKDITNLLEELFTNLFETLRPEAKIKKPFPRLDYSKAIERFGTDKPDLRFEMEIKDLSDIAKQCEFIIFTQTIDKGGKVKGICIPGCATYSRHQLNELNDFAKSIGAQGLVTLSIDSSAPSIDEIVIEEIKSVVVKYLNIDQIRKIASRLGASAGDLLLIIADDDYKANTILGKLRIELGNRLKLADPNTFSFAFVENFPLLEWNKENKCYQPMHHPFTSPRDEDISLLNTSPEKVFGRHYDMVLNGYEIAGGSIRIHKSNLQRKVFRLMGYSDEDIDQRFGHLLRAFDFGAPPHGGVAAGIDRILMLMMGENTIREVIPFPKTQNAVDLLFDTPSSVSDEQLAELHLNLREE
jgi:aspartyl-tRNA synthetase